MPRPAHSEEQRNEIRRRILGGAQELFDASGIEAVSMRALGKRVGLTASALYAYFPAKIDLLRALWWDTLDALYAKMAELSRKEPDPVAAVRGLGLAYVEFALENPSRFRVLFMVDQGDLAAELRGEVGVHHAAYRLFRQRVAEAIDQKRLRLDDADLAAQVLWAGVHGTLTLTNTSRSFPFHSPHLLAATAIDVLMAGLAVAPQPKE